MPGRTSKLMLGAGAVVVLGLAIALVQLTRGATPALAVAGRAPAVAQAPAPAVAPAAPSAPLREHRATPAATHGPLTAAPRAPELAPAAAGFDRELKRDANGKLVPIVFVQDLREQVHRLDAPMKACIERSGQRPTGKATLAFTVAAKANKLVIETTAVQDEDTLGSYPELLECMRQTATASAFALDGRPIPELGTPIYVRRHVRLDAGELAENSIFDFSYAH